MYKLNDRKQAEEYLRGLTLAEPEEQVRKVVINLHSRRSKYSLYNNGIDRKTGVQRIPICSKGTVDKIKRLLDEGKLDSYLDYIDQSPDVSTPLNKPLENSKEKVQVSEQLPKETSNDALLIKHFDRVVTTADQLASRVAKLVYYRESQNEIRYNEGNIVDGLHFFGRHRPDNMDSSIEPRMARCVLAHYEHKFDRLYCNYFEEVTMENARQELADNLLRLASNPDSEPCPICPECQELAHLPVIGRNWTRFKDEKTGKWSYMPLE